MNNIQLTVSKYEIMNINSPFTESKRKILITKTQHNPSPQNTYYHKKIE